MSAKKFFTEVQKSVIQKAIADADKVMNALLHEEAKSKKKQRNGKK